MLSVSLTPKYHYFSDAASLPAGCRSSITGFGQTDGMANWQCAECDFDLCGACANHYDAEDIARIDASAS